MSILKKGAALTAALVFAASFPLAAEETSNAYHFLDIPTSAHVMGLGGNNICVIDDDVALADQNPALIGPELDMAVNVNYMYYMYMYYMGSSNFAGVRYGMAAGEHSAWAIGLRYLNYGKMQGFDEMGTPTGEFSPYDMVVEGTYSRDITDRWRGGVNVKFAYSQYEQYTAAALATDLGVNYYDDEHDLSFSVVLKNMGGQIKRFGDRYNRVPFDIQIGYMQGIAGGPISVSITANNLVRWRIPYYSYNTDSEEQFKKESGFFSNLFRHLIFGLQYAPSEKFYIDLAYNYKTHSDMSTFNRNFFSGFSVGAGFRVKGFGLGLAYAQPHRSGSTLMVNLNCSIGELIH